MTDTLMFSVSGLRGLVGVDLTPEVVARYASALGAWALAHSPDRGAVVLGRDARTSGEMFLRAATAGLQSVGADVVDLGLVPTPTVQIAVEHHHAAAGLILTASHNPVEWNALKFVGPDGTFLGSAALAEVKALAEAGAPRRGWDGIGNVIPDPEAIERHLAAVLALPEVDVAAIRARRFHVALDCVRGAGGVIIPELLARLGCRVDAIYTETDGRFPHEPEPVPANLTALGELVRSTGAEIGLAVDPDVDRLALVDETGVPIGEDYTLAFAVRAVLSQHAPGATVVANLSTSRVVEDAALAGEARFLRAPVGEANVVGTIRDEGAVIGGEGNGGVILPVLHCGRDAPLGVALVLQYLVGSGGTVSERVRGAPSYQIVKTKIPRGVDLETAGQALLKRFPEALADRRDGLRLAWPDRWVHLRPSGTEPVVRIIAEAPSVADAEGLTRTCRDLLRSGATERTS